MLLKVQALVNSPEEGEAPWSGDEALRHFCAQVARDVRVRMIEPQAPQVRAAEDGFGGGPSPKKKAKKEYVSGGGWHQQRNVQPLVGGGVAREPRPGQQKCSTCAKNCSHASGRCSRCGRVEAGVQQQGGPGVTPQAGVGISVGGALVAQ